MGGGNERGVSASGPVLRHQSKSARTPHETLSGDGGGGVLAVRVGEVVVCGGGKKKKDQRLDSKASDLTRRDVQVAKKMW